MAEETNELLTLTADIVSAHVANNSLATAEVPALIQSVYAALSKLGAPVEPPAPEKPKGAVSIRASIKPDALISMIDGKAYRTLRRHLTTHGHMPESYSEAYNLPHDYPMVAASYAEQRRALAHKIGLGKKPASSAAKPRARKPKAGATA